MGLRDLINVYLAHSERYMNAAHYYLMYIIAHLPLKIPMEEGRADSSVFHMGIEAQDLRLISGNAQIRTHYMFLYL